MEYRLRHLAIKNKYLPIPCKPTLTALLMQVLCRQPMRTNIDCFINASALQTTDANKH